MRGGIRGAVSAGDTGGPMGVIMRHCVEVASFECYAFFAASTPGKGS
jgi:hypothetical protein